MIQPLRTAHRTIFLLLGIGLPVLFVAAIRSRVPEQHLPGFGPVDSLSAKPVAEFRLQSDDAVGRISLALIQVGEGGLRRYLLHAESGPFASPELLLYWSPTASNTKEIPADAELIGPARLDREFELAANQLRTGSLLLYDTPHKKVLAQLALEQR